MRPSSQGVMHEIISLISMSLLFSSSITSLITGGLIAAVCYRGLTCSARTVKTTSVLYCAALPLPLTVAGLGLIGSFPDKRFRLHSSMYTTLTTPVSRSNNSLIVTVNTSHRTRTKYEIAVRSGHFRVGLTKSVHME